MMRGLAEALALAEQGVPVFPCHKDKSPACRHGFYDANTDPLRLRKMWNGPHLVGIRTGSASGIAVLDIDVQHGGDVWLAEHLDRLETRVHETRSGGFHLLFKHRPGLNCSTAVIAPGVDVKAERGSCMWWAAHGYPVLDDRPLADLAPWPDWIVIPERAVPERPPGGVIPDDYQIERLCRFVMESSEGERNGRLYWAACRMAELTGRFLSAAVAEHHLARAAVAAGLNPQEAERTIRSGMRNG